MTRLRGLLAATLFAAVISAGAGAVDFRWTSGFGQGVSSAQVLNQAGSIVQFSCNSGGLPPIAPSLRIEIRGKPLPGAKLYQFVIDGRNHAVSLTDGWLTAQVRFEVNALMMIADALVQSNAQGFVVEVPEARVAERFSLLNVRDALGPRAGATLAECR
ncbi:MAG TPA: hypothetical protein VJ890_08080 [Vineibacter sp.]|nr:hypothetical protein [Vineibacter sp.]